jgi:hypothetical protein
MEWRLLDDTELSFSAVYFCDSTDTRRDVICFGRMFPHCSGVAWWTDETVLFIFDAPIPVNDCARLYNRHVEAGLFYAPSKLNSAPVGFEDFDQANKYVLLIVI